MANYFPLVANVTGNSGLFTELPSGGNLDLTGSGIKNLAVANLGVTGGSNGQMLKTDGTGNLAWATVDTFKISNGNSNVSVDANSNITVGVAGNSNVAMFTATGMTTKDFLATGNASLSNTTIDVANLHITGGNSAQYLQTDGTGALIWATINTDRITKGNSNVIVDGANANVNAELNVSGNTVITGNLTVNGTTTTVNSTTVSTNDKNIVLAANATTAAQASGGGISIAGANANITYNNTSNRFEFTHSLTANVVGSASTVTTNAQPNITSVGNLASLTVSGVTSLGDVANVSITGGNASNGYQYLKTDGSGVLSWAKAGTVTSVGITEGTGITVIGGNITTAGNLTVSTTAILELNKGNNISITSGNKPVLSVDTFNFAKETLNINANAATGTINLDVLGNAITYYTGVATGNVTLNIRGDANVTANIVLSNNQSVTTTFIMNTGTAGYTANVFKIDGANVTPKWAGNTSPIALANVTQTFTLTSIKTAPNTYTVLGSFTGYY